MTKQILKQNIQNISTMTALQLEEFGQKASLSNMDKKAQTYLFRALEIRQCELSECAEINSFLVVESKIDNS